MSTSDGTGTDRRVATVVRDARTIALLSALVPTVSRRRLVARSVVVAAGTRRVRRLLVAGSRSTVVRSVRTVGRRLRRALAGAAITRPARTGHTWLQASWLYRWLTAEPEPEVIVIDLRETLALGPLIAAIDRVFRWLLPAAPTALVVTAVTRAADRFRQRPLRAVGFLLVAVITTAVPGLAVVGALGPVTVAAALVGALLALAGLRSAATLADLREHPITRTLVAALEPPEPPE
jgi:hypothetical protein